jgi:nucleotide-binding universal stress UspA family protein
MRDILVHVDASPAGAARVHSAIDLARQFGAPLTGLHVRPDVDLRAARLIELEAMVERAEEFIDEDARESHHLFLASVERAGVPHVWRVASGDVARHIVDTARYVDLVILGQYERQGTAIHHPLPVCHAVGLRCGRPVLVLPGDTEKCVSLSRVALAWDGSREAVRAVHDAMPFLTRATELDVLVVRPRAEHLADEVVSPYLLTEHLAHHGIAVSSWTTLEGDSVADALFHHIEGHRFDLLVLGAYAHPAWYEFILGGVTQSLLLRSPIPLLISH